MEREELLNAIAASLAAVNPAHYHEDERGFQGEFYAQLHYRLRDLVVPDGAVLREEYQKTLGSHGLRIRPDIILHEPFNQEKHAGRDEGNHAVMELKRSANRSAATKAMSSLVAMIDTLNYPLGVFININATETWADVVPQDYRPRIVCFAVSVNQNGTPSVVRA